MATRNLGTIPISTLQANNIDWAFYVRLDFPSGPGTVRYTDHPTLGSGATETLNIDGTSQVWTEWPFLIPSISQTKQGILNVSYISFGNLDWTFSNWANSPGIKRVPISVYVAWFASDGSLAGSYIAYKGKMDDGVYKESAVITLKPSTTPWGKSALSTILGPLCPYIFKDPDTCQYPGLNTTCSHTRSSTDGCGAGFNNNLAHFGGDDLQQPPGTVLYWGGDSYNV